MSEAQHVSGASKPGANIRQAVPFLRVADLETSLRFYIDGLGFEMKNRWMVEGMIRWCWLENGAAAMMLQEFAREGHDPWKPEGKVGVGVSICFICDDAPALYREVVSRGVAASRPFVGNRMWVTTVTDPDGYVLEFESPTDLPEETQFSE